MLTQQGVPAAERAPLVPICPASFAPARYFYTNDDLNRRARLHPHEAVGVRTSAVIESLERESPDPGISCTAVEAGP